ncbi:hypothetical protein BTJ68_02411 [Hortaea werneckii EXF-2000]|uniref:Uncharacterized protein n=1 Tax=Hortaea werneckii EXF-2000 TaxID=1157616 RepID=A0A1Z5TPF2_HORWE|nr:hypothetical protein BTJ68_02411 [Hortaea werneckii EXF-2000]
MPVIGASQIMYPSMKFSNADAEARMFHGFPIIEFMPLKKAQLYADPPRLLPRKYNEVFITSPGSWQAQISMPTMAGMQRRALMLKNHRSLRGWM